VSAPNCWMKTWQHRSLSCCLFSLLEVCLAWIMQSCTIWCFRTCQDANWSMGIQNWDSCWIGLRKQSRLHSSPIEHVLCCWRGCMVGQDRPRGSRPSPCPFCSLVKRQAPASCHHAFGVKKKACDWRVSTVTWPTFAQSASRSSKRRSIVCLPSESARIFTSTSVPLYVPPSQPPGSRFG